MAYERLPDIVPPCVECSLDWYVERHVNCREYCAAWAQWVAINSQIASGDYENTPKTDLNKKDGPGNDQQKRKA